MSNLACANVRKLRTLKKYVRHIFHSGRRVPIQKWNAEIASVMSLTDGDKFRIPYIGSTGCEGECESVEFELAQFRLGPRGKPVTVIVGYTINLREVCADQQGEAPDPAAVRHWHVYDVRLKAEQQ